VSEGAAELTDLLQFARGVDCAEDAEAVFEAAYNEIGRALGYQTVWLHLCDLQLPGRARLAWTLGPAADSIAGHAKVLHVQHDCTSRKAGLLVVPDARGDSTFSGFDTEGAGSRTIVLLRLGPADAPFGFLGAGTFGDEGPKPPTAAELAYLECMALHLTAAFQRHQQKASDLLGGAPTEEEKAAVWQSLAEWHATFDALHVSVVVVDADGRMRRSNRTAAQLLGVAVHLVPGRALPNVEPWAAVRRALERLSDPAMAVVEATARTTSGAQYRVKVSRGIEGQAVAVLEDVTVTEALATQVEVNRGLVELGSFVAGVAHEVRNPLFAITANLDALRAEAEPAAMLHEYLPRIYAEAERLSSFMHDLLEFARPAREPRRAVMVDKLIERAHAALRMKTQQRKVTLAVEVGEGIVATVDAGRIEEALRNLIDNAIAFSPVGGTVRISARARGDELELTVIDAGPGFAKDDIPRACDPFFTRRRGGTGLGLPIARRHVTEHGGELVIDNCPWGGGKVTMRLPSVLARPQLGQQVAHG
jgi:signal transduction histidine kinase